MKLSGKVALVTGSSRGIGKAIAIHLAQLGADIVVNYYKGREEADDTVREILSLGRRSLAIQADVSDNHSVDNMFMEIMKSFGTVDILVNNAGINRDSLLLRMKEEDWEQVLNTNLKGVYLCSKHASRVMMKKRQGKIVNISSVIGVAGNIGQSNYAAAKAGIIGFSKSIAKELASRNIQVNVVAPGFIETDMTDKLPDQLKQAILSQIPLGRFGDPIDVANVVGFLVSDESRYITGQVIHVDGGMII